MDKILLGTSRLTKSDFVMRFNYLATIILLSVSIAAPFASDALATEQKRMDLVELFTSQGCSSCPPADHFLGELAQRKNVVALTLPVSYWDHLGWKDTLAKDTHNQRQRDYAAARGDREIYTPQMVVNGISHVVGSRPGAVDATLEKTRKSLMGDSVPVAVQSDGSEITAQIGDAPEGGNFRSGTVWFAFYTSGVNVDIQRGENYGRKITYSNVVRYLMPAGRWEGQPASFSVTRPKDDKVDGCAAFLQADKNKAVLGAAQLTALAH